MIGADPRVILSGRETNDEYPAFIIDQCQQWLVNKGVINPHILFMGIAFKEDVPDVRNSKAFELAQKFKSIAQSLEVIDPIADLGDHAPGFSFNAKAVDATFDVVVLAVPHADFMTNAWSFILKHTREDNTTLVMDIKARLNREAIPKHVDLWRP
jgi:UDP-N-acetyl-D-galactosamine dehydrogenase